MLRQLAEDGIRHRGEIRFRRQRTEGGVEQLAGGLRIDVADHGDFQRVLRQHALRIVFQIGGLDDRQAFHRSVRRARIGMRAIGLLPEFAARNRDRIGGFAARVGDHLRTHALQRLGVEPRGCQRQLQEAESFVAMLLEHLHRAAQIVARGREGHLDGAALQPFVEGLGIQISRAFVQRVGGEAAGAGFVGGVLRRAAGEGIFHRDQRHGGVLNQPGFNAAL